ncbi:unnamed protein product [Moneuplotes crassus]|uniref:USP domain-containing protein n=1 Tax=Euplotes crassus TaxID=5936 RepID=A0AAD1X8V0_EUPCR|nr:unnamed protein product [Moneuplotes crassus]
MERTLTFREEEEKRARIERIERKRRERAAKRAREANEKTPEQTELEERAKKRKRDLWLIGDSEATCWKHKVDWDGEIEEEKASGTWKGIANTGLNCFMISSLQSLLGLREFVDYFNCTFNKEILLDAKISILFEQLVKQYFDPKCRKVSIDKLRDKFEDEFPKHQQHDAVEFILEIFDILRNEQNPSEQTFLPIGYKDHYEAWDKYLEFHSSIVDRLFMGMEESTYHCEGCSEEVKRYEEFLNISLPSSPKITVKGFMDFLSKSTSKEE